MARLLPRLGRAILLLSALAVVGGCALIGSSNPGPPGTAVVVRVVDGDTVTLHIDGVDEDARLLGIDTPETVKPGAPVDCFGPEASARAKALLPHGTRVRISRDVELRDRFDRLLVYLWRVSDDLFVNRDLVAGGWARPLSIEPNHAYRSLLADAATGARASRRGLWRHCPPSGVPERGG